MHLQLFIPKRFRVNILVFVFSLACISVYGQTNTITFKGRVLEKGTQESLEGVTVILPQYSLWTITDKDGYFSIPNTPIGNTDLVFRVLGYVTVEQKFNIQERSTKSTFFMEQNTLRLKEVEVSARMKKEGATPVTNISRTAIDHIQATSLADVLNLLPGSVPSNQSLSSTSTVALRNYVDANTNSKDIARSSMAMGSMGTSIIVDNAPISNNSNLQVLAPSAGVGASFESVAGSGIDLRQISADNIESVDIIRGIASVQYGDASSGAVIVRSKAGKSPLLIRFKMNPNITQSSITTGHSLGGKNGNLNVSFDYAHSLNKENEAANTYNRYSAKLLYSNTFFSKLRSNFSLDLISAKDDMKQDEDDVNLARKKYSDNNGFRFNANGAYMFNGPWLKTLQYAFSTSYTNQKSYYQELKRNAESIYSTAMSDNSVIGANPGQHVHDAYNNQLTHWVGNDQNAYAFSTKDAYLGSYNINGKEWNTFASLKAVFAKDYSIVNHRFIIGGDFKSEGNKGEGKTFDIKNPPSTTNAKAIRERSYKDIPFIQTYGFYGEENLRLEIDGRELDLQLGLRLDKQRDIKMEITPRVNASFEILKRKLFIRGGYGEIIKSAPLLYLYPENAYFDILNYTDKATNVQNPQYLMTTRVFDTRNYDLRLAKNKKAEIGVDLFIGSVSLNLTAYSEKMKNGYNFLDYYTPIAYDKYIDGNAGLVHDEVNSRNVYVRYNKPGNSLYIDTKGFDFDLNIARIDAIRTSFILSGGYMETKSHDANETYYINNDNLNSAYVGIYEPGYEKYKRTRFATNLRIVHNIPELGFVVSLSAVTTWVNSSQKLMTNDSIPVAYLSLADNSRHLFDPADADKSEYSSIVWKKYLNKNRFIAEEAPVLWSFNLNLTKEIGKNLAVSFFANNLFSYNPRWRKKGTDSYYTLNPKSFFGIELSAKIPW